MKQIFFLCARLGALYLKQRLGGPMSQGEEERLGGNGGWWSTGGGICST